MASRRIEVQIVGDAKQLERTFGQAARSAKGFQASVTGVSSGVNRLVAAAGAAVGVKTLFNALQGATQAASDLNEEVNKSRVVFGRSGADIISWSKTTATSFGISQRAALAAAGSFGQILETAGLTQTKAAQFSRQLVELAGDMASFNNISTDEALEKLRSGLAGEAEPLRTVGVLLSEARVQQEAYAAGIAKSGSKLTEAQKVQARFNLILKDTNIQQGDAGRTIGQLAGQQRVLAAQTENLQAKLGAALLPAVLKVTSGLNKWLSNTENQQRVQSDFKSVIDAVGATLKAFVEIVRVVAPIVREAAQAVGGLGNAVKLLVAALAISKIRAFLAAFQGFSLGMAAAERSTVGLNRALATFEASALVRFGRVGGAAARLATSLALLARPITVVIGIEVLRGGKELKTIRDGVKEVISDLGRGDFKKAFGGDPAGLRQFAAAADDIKRRMEALPKSAQQAVAKIGEALNQDPTKTLKEKIDALNAAITAIGGASAARASDGIEAVRSSIEAAIARTENFGQKLADVKKTAGKSGGVTAGQRNTFFDNALGRDLDRVEDLGLEGRLSKLQSLADRIRAQIAKVKDSTRKLKLGDDLRGVVRQINDVKQAIRDSVLDSLQLGVDKATLTKSLNDDLAAINAALAGVQQQINAEGKTNDLERQRLSLLQQRSAILDQQKEALQKAAEARKAARTARQFRALGFASDGSNVVPGVERLRNELAGIDKAVEGTFLDTGKTESLLKRIRKVLSGGLGALSKDVRAKVQEMLAGIDRQLKEHAGTGTKAQLIDVSKVLEGLTGPASALAAAQQALAGATAPLRAGREPAVAAAGGTVIHNVTVNNPANFDAFMREVDKRTNRGSRPRR